MDYELSSYEKETIITYNKAEKTAEIYTCNEYDMNYYDKLCVEFKDHYKLIKSEKYNNKIISKTYEVSNKKLCRCKKPKILSEEQKEEFKKRMQNK